jgi:hypothetical protein
VTGIALAESHGDNVTRRPGPALREQPQSLTIQ